jgi:hypothetical protein
LITLTFSKPHIKNAATTVTAFFMSKQLLNPAAADAVKPETHHCKKQHAQKEIAILAQGFRKAMLGTNALQACIDVIVG